MSDRLPTSLYLISPPQIAHIPAFAQELQGVIEAGDVACFQLRLKGLPDADVLHAASILFPVAQELGVACIMNDRPDLALQAGADGVHIGQSDASYTQARQTLGKAASIGVTCHDSRHLAMVAAEEGADYVAFGAFYETVTKSAPSRANSDILSWWQDIMEIPCVAIGGITPDNGETLVRAGADFLAVSAGVWSSPEGSKVASARFAEMFARCAS